MTNRKNSNGRGAASYLTFISGRAGDEFDLAFGKNGEDFITGIGMALARYATFKEPTFDFDADFSALCACNTIDDILSNETALIELCRSVDLINLISTNTYAIEKLIINTNTVAAVKSDRVSFENIASNTTIIDSIRTNEYTRAQFNKNRIRILAPGNVSWTVPDDFPCDFVHIQLIGGGGESCGEYIQGFMNVTPGQTITGSIGLGANTVFGEFTANSGKGASQSGSWLVKASDGGNQTWYNTSFQYRGGIGGFEGGQGQNGKSNSLHSDPDRNSNNAGKGDGTLGHCEGTGGSGSGYGVATDGGGGGRISDEFAEDASRGAAGGGGYGGGGMRVYAQSSGAYSSGSQGGSGAIVITCPDGYIPEFVVYNTIDGVTAWRRDENIFNDFGENA